MEGRHAFRRSRFFHVLSFLFAVLLLGIALLFQSCGGETADNGGSGTSQSGGSQESAAGSSDDTAGEDAAGDTAAADAAANNDEPREAEDADSSDAAAANEAGSSADAGTAGDDQAAVAGSDQAAVAGDLAFDVRTLAGTLPMDNKDEYMAYMLENSTEDETYLSRRWDRSRVAIGYGDFEIDRIREAFLYTPREHFARDWNADRVYDHSYLSIGYGQTISGPHIVITMTESINPQPDHKVLEIGTGSGYQSAFLARLSNHVYTIEIVEPLALETDEIYTELEDEYPMYGNVTRKVDDGYYGWEEYAPFDRIIVTAGIDHIPPELIRQLAPEGEMVIPVGPPSGQTILKVTKVVEDDGLVRLIREDIYDGRLKDVFVPFTSSEGGTHNRSE